MGIFLSFAKSTLLTARGSQTPLLLPHPFRLHPALQVLGDQVSFIVLRQVITSNEALLALGTLKTLVACQEEETKATLRTLEGICTICETNWQHSRHRWTAFISLFFKGRLRSINEAMGQDTELEMRL